MVMLLAVLSGCSDTISDFFGGDGIEKGEPVQFTTMVPDVPKTRTTAKDDWEKWEKEVKAYKPMPRDYSLTIEMFKKDAAERTSIATYKRPENVADADVEDPNYDYSIRQYDGTLEPAGSDKLYWLDINSEWGFKATAGTTTIEADQSDQSKWVAQDKLIGYSYLPIWDETNQKGTDDLNAINYRTPRQWYEGNQTAKELSGLMVGNNNDYKKIPLYMQHERAWITVILRAAEGVKREALFFSTAEENIQTTIYSYDADNNKFEITRPWANEATIDYKADKNGPERNGVSTTRYDAIVNPYDYSSHLDNPIVTIALSGLKFNYFAASDTRYRDYGTQHESDEYKQWQSIYNLTAGKHLTIEATLSRETLKILITAWIEDWTEAITSTICDDYGNNGDPIVINNRQELIDFLKGSDNAAGTVAIIQPKNMDLDTGLENDEDKDKVWSTLLNEKDFTLNATLNMAGSVFHTSAPFLKEIATSGSIINGTISVKEGATVTTAICDKNYGMLERMKVVAAPVTTERASVAKATQAGMVNKNYGTIYLCSSELNVYGSTGYVGGIAAENLYRDASIMPVIDACTVNANVDVDGADDVKGGGIAGHAAGRITNCTFEYGITLSQNSDNFKNIFSVQVPGSDLRANNNRWPTTALNPISSNDNENLYVNAYDAVINCETELATLLKTSSYNQSEKRYRLSDNFAVSSDTWLDANNKPLGKIDDNRESRENGNVFFDLYGNDKVITLTGTKEVKYYSGNKPEQGTLTQTVQTAPMLFTNVMGKIYDLNLYLDKPVVSEPSVANDNNSNDTHYSGVDAIAPLAYSVYGGTGLISNVKVKAKEGANGAYVQSATPGGLVVWAYGTESFYPTIENCVVDTKVRMWMPYTWSNTEARQYCGGIVAMASFAKITQCQYITEGASAIGPAVSDEDYRTATGKTTYPANSSKCFYGGIVGGTSYAENRSDAKAAKLIINDCSSWYNVTTPCSHGSIIGFVLYNTGDGNSTLNNAMAEGNTGNWWPESSYAISNFTGNPKEEIAVGTRNNVQPTKREIEF